MVVAVVVAVVVVAAACSGAPAGSTVGGPGEAARGTPAEDVPADPSPGCGAGGTRPTSSSPSPVPGTDEQVTLATGEGERWYLRHVPPAHVGSTPVPLVVDLHGYAEGADVHVVHTGLGAHGDAAGFVTVTPQGSGLLPGWRLAADSPDVAFVEQVLDDVEATLCVDRARVYVAGLSNGAMLASVLACELPDRIAAVAVVAGVTAVPGCGAGDDPGATPRPVPVVAFHGTEDPFLGYDGGFGDAVAALPAPDGDGTLGEAGVAADPDVVAPPVPDVLAAWAIRNGCDGDPPAEEALADDVTRLTWACPAGADVVLHRIEGGGSTWPGSDLLRHASDIVGVTTRSISATEVIADFFADHALPPRRR
ncbi:MAG TPA: PHB depolymerase family esterase [Acidimicrobiales bacterium]